jgi:hypothetical protein
MEPDTKLTIVSFGGHVVLNADGTMQSWHFSANATYDQKQRVEIALYEGLIRLGYTPAAATGKKAISR